MSVAYQTVEAALAAAVEAPPERSAAVFASQLGYLLPSSARTIGETWSPEDAADLDGWARLGYLLGALDARMGIGPRMRGTSSRAKQVYAAAYTSAGFWVAQILAVGS
jgi:hypothetical protein